MPHFMNGTKLIILGIFGRYVYIFARINMKVWSSKKVKFLMVMALSEITAYYEVPLDIMS